MSLAFLGVIILLGHFTIVLHPQLLTKELDHQQLHEQFTYTRQFSLELLIGFVVVICFGVFFVAFVILPISEMQAYFPKWKKKEESMLTTHEIHDSDFFPRGSVRKYCAIIFAWFLAIIIGLWLTSYPIRYAGGYFCFTDARDKIRHNRNAELGGGAWFFEETLHYCIGIFIAIAITTIIVGIVFVFNVGISGIKEDWKIYRQRFFQKTR